MTIEELKEYCVRQITEFEMAKEILPVTPNDYRHYEEHKIVLQLIEALEQQPCEDCISRQVVLDMLEDINAETEGVGFYYEHYVEYIKNLPPVTPKKEIGHWILISKHSIDGEHPSYDMYECSRCKYQPLTNHHNYCPNCGIKMIESYDVPDINVGEIVESEVRNDR